MAEDIKTIKDKLDKLQKDFDDFKSKYDKKAPFKVFEDVKYYPILKVDRLSIIYIEAAAASIPTPPLNSIALWKDTTNTKYYLQANFKGTQKKVELT